MSDYYYFFHSAQRRRGGFTLAPERLGGGKGEGGREGGGGKTALLVGLEGREGGKEGGEEELRPSMDMFSLGCVLGEMYMDGEGPFDLPGMLEYRGEGGREGGK